MKIEHTNYRYRLLARLILQAETPIAIGSGDSDITTDSLVARDVNGLPYIPGTSIAGVLRNQLKVEDNSILWGYQIGNKGRGSEVIFTEAKILNSKGEAVDGILDPLTIISDPFLANYIELPIRQHVCINERGVAANSGKFDEQIVYKGTQFCFEIEVVSDSNDLSVVNAIVDAARSQSLRVGGGTRKGFGKIKVVAAKTTCIDLKTELDRYLSKSSNLSESQSWWDKVEPYETKEIPDSSYTKYELLLEPLNFFAFGSGFGDDTGEADSTTVKEGIVADGKFIGNRTLIPATSVKGALRHRVAFYYNKLRGKVVGDREATTADKCMAVQELFGYNDTKQHRGRVMISDVFEKPAKKKLITHVSIDRFTGGAEKGALFTEQTDFGKGLTFNIQIYVDNAAFIHDSAEKPIRAAFEKAMEDICKGMLPLGGNVNRGNGIFTGKLLKDGKEHHCS